MILCEQLKYKIDLHTRPCNVLSTPALLMMNGDVFEIVCYCFLFTVEAKD